MDTNFFRIKVEHVHFFQYDLDIVPVPRSSSDCRKFLEIALYHAKVAHEHLLYDFPEDDAEPVKIFYSRTRLDKIDNPFSFTDENKKTGKSVVYTIRVRETREVSGNDCSPQFISVVLNDSIQRLNYVTLKSGFFNLEDIKAVERTKVRLARGFNFSVNKSERGANYTLCIKPEFVTLQAETVSDRIREMRSSGKTEDEISEALRNKKIFVPHSNRFYKIMGLNFGIKPTDAFPEGTEYKTYVDYFQKRYTRLPQIYRAFKEGDVFRDMENDNCMVRSMIPLKQRNSRMVRHNITELPPTLCIMGGQPELRPLDQASVTQARQLTPGQTMNEVRGIIRRIAGLASPTNVDDGEVRREKIRDILRNWGVEIESEPIRVEQKKLQMPTILIGPERAERMLTPNPNDGSFRNGLRGPLFRAADKHRPDPFKNWILVCNDRDKNNFWNNDSRKILSTMGIPFTDPELITPRYVNGTEIDRLANRLRSERRLQRISIVIIGLANNDANTYKDVKRACAKNNLVSQCINMKNLASAFQKRRQDSYLWGLFQQIVGKVGGIVWAGSLSVPSVRGSPTMLCGIHYVPPIGVSTSQGGDNQFASRGSGEGQHGYISMCSTFDKNFVNHFNQCRPVDSKKITRGGTGPGIENTLRIMAQNAVDFFAQQTNAFIPPKQIIIFRSGMPDGEVRRAVESEIKAIKEGIAKFMIDKKHMPEEEARRSLPKIVFVVARRRCNARFTQSNNNLVPGSYVDDDRLVIPGKEFYLVSGFTPRRGANDPPCSKPVHYSISLNECSDTLSTRDIMQVIFQTSFNYVNYPGPQSLPTTLRYAVSLAQHVSEKSGYAPETILSKESMNAYPFFI